MISIHNTKPSTEICKHCFAGKMTKLPFVESSFKSSFTLQLMHSDVSGLAPIDSSSGFRYYELFVDEYTKFTWLFPMK